jgi:arginyl-tRNA--protein-N-Asp/Glu arginylyltransferase
MGMGMMTRAVEHAKQNNKKYLYLGSAQRPNDTYKFQFEGIEWFDGTEWQDDINEIKELLK